MNASEAKDKKFQIWTCKILVPYNSELPDGFDYPPRQAATDAIEKAGIRVIACASGWGGALTKDEQEFYNKNTVSPNDIYYAGLVDAEPEGNG